MLHYASSQNKQSLFQALISLLIATTAIATAGAGEITGKVVSVKDGDTLEVRTENETIKVRLAEIDAPEKKQPYGSRAKEALSQMCFGKTALIKPAGIDRYKRTIGRVNCAGKDANAELVKQGFAWAYTKYLTDPSIARYQESAIAARAGLWKDPSPTAPWEWRKSQREGKLNPSK